MPLIDVPLEEHLRPAEVGLRLASGARGGAFDSSGLRDVHPPAAAADAAFTSTG